MFARKEYVQFFQQTSDDFSNGCMVTITKNWGISLINEVTWLCVIVMIQWLVKIFGSCWKNSKYVLVQNTGHILFSQTLKMFSLRTQEDIEENISYICLVDIVNFWHHVFCSCFCHEESRWIPLFFAKIHYNIHKTWWKNGACILGEHIAVQKHSRIHFITSWKWSPKGELWPE